MKKASFSMPFGRLRIFVSILFAFCAHAVFAQNGPGASNDYSFFVAGDMRNFLNGAPQGKRFFDGACDAMKQAGPAAFLLSPGDCDPPAPIRQVIDHHLGTNFLWYPLVGNHDVEHDANMEWWREWAKAGIPNLVRSGPPGNEALTYSFDFGNSHFVMLDEYFNGHASSAKSPPEQLSEATLHWLELDLAANRQPLIWVCGHKPIESLPDMDTGRLRHKGESVTPDAHRRAQFLSLLRRYQVTGYICGHTHDCSIAKVDDGIWQLDSGHSRGGGDSECPSTFLKVHVNGLHVAVDVYRSNTNGLDYHVTRSFDLK